MNKLTVLVSLSMLAVLGGRPIRAEESPMMDKEGHLEQRMEHLKKNLNLTPEQIPVVESALKEKREKMEALRQETIEKTKAIHADSTAKINAVLNAEQQAKYKAMQDKAMEKMSKHREQKKGMMK